MKKIFIKNKSGEKLAGILHEADSDKLVIVCHGRLTTKDDYFLPELCEAISCIGINAFRFDFAGNGESEGKFEDSTITKAIEDLKCAVDHFQTNFDILSLIGHSMGGVIVLLHQVKYSSAKSVVDIAGVVNQREYLLSKYSDMVIRQINSQRFVIQEHNGKKIVLSKKYLDDRASYGDISKKARMIKVPVLIVHGKNDEDIPYNNALVMKNAILANDLISIDGAGHFFEKTEHKMKLMDSIISWINSKKKHLYTKNNSSA